MVRIIKADFAFGAPNGNDLQFPEGVFGNWYLYCLRRALLHWSWFDGMVPRNLHVCGDLRQSNALEFVIFSFQGISISLSFSRRRGFTVLSTKVALFP